MAKFEFRLPDIGEGVTEGEIVAWLVQRGARVEESQDLVEIMTDKATVTIGAPKTGRVLELRGDVGDTVPVGQVLVVLGLGEDDVESAVLAPSATPEPAPETPEVVAQAPSPAPSAPEEEGSGATAVGDIRTTLPGVSLAAATPQSSSAASPGGVIDGRALAAPATRRLARELGVDLKTVTPTGKGGRVTSADVAAARGARAPAAIVAGGPEPTAPRLMGSGERKPIRGLRKRIFENMARSKRTAVHFTYVDECEVTPLRTLREELQPFAERAGTRLTYLPFVVKAVVRALKLHPALNAWVDDATHEIVYPGTYHLGIAVSSEAGLIVPVLREADRRSLLEIAREIERLGNAARAGKVTPEDLGGSSFTITSLGKLGGLLATPVINYPEVGILGIHAIQRRPVVRDDAVVIGETMWVSLSFDHRVIDGHVGAAFAQEVLGALREPKQLLLDG